MEKLIIDEALVNIFGQGIASPTLPCASPPPRLCEPPSGGEAV